MNRKIEIAKQMADLAGELQEIDANEIKALAAEANSYKLEWMSRIGEAMLHKKLQIKPTTKELGYALAEDYSLIYEDLNPYNSKKTLPANVLKTLKEMLKHFDLMDYVFAKTRYDECSNGFFFRRS